MVSTLDAAKRVLVVLLRTLAATYNCACEHANTYYEVADLCNSLPDQLKLLVDKEGERLKYYAQYYASGVGACV